MSEHIEVNTQIGHDIAPPPAESEFAEKVEALMGRIEADEDINRSAAFLALKELTPEQRQKMYSSLSPVGSNFIKFCRASLKGKEAQAIAVIEMAKAGVKSLLISDEIKKQGLVS